MCFLTFVINIGIRQEMTRTGDQHPYTNAHDATQSRTFLYHSFHANACCNQFLSIFYSETCLKGTLNIPKRI